MIALFNIPKLYHCLLKQVINPEFSTYPASATEKQVIHSGSNALYNLLPTYIDQLANSKCWTHISIPVYSHFFIIWVSQKKLFSLRICQHDLHKQYCHHYTKWLIQKEKSHRIHPGSWRQLLHSSLHLCLFPFFFPR